MLGGKTTLARTCATRSRSEVASRLALEWGVVPRVEGLAPDPAELLPRAVKFLDASRREASRRQRTRRGMLVALLCLPLLLLLFGQQWRMTQRERQRGEEIALERESMQDPTFWELPENVGQYRDDRRNVYVDGKSNLVFHAAKDGKTYYSGKVFGKWRGGIGHIWEARIKLDCLTAGCWPAWYLANNSPVNGGEVDIMEWVGRTPTRIFGTIHGPGYNGAGGIGRLREEREQRVHGRRLSYEAQRDLREHGERALAAEHQLLHGDLGLVIELVAVAMDEFDAVVFEGIVRGGNHHAQIGAHRPRQHRDRRGRHRPHLHHVHPDRSETRHHRIFNHIA